MCCNTTNNVLRRITEMERDYEIMIHLHVRRLCSNCVLKVRTSTVFENLKELKLSVLSTGPGRKINGELLLMCKRNYISRSSSYIKESLRYHNTI